MKTSLSKFVMAVVVLSVGSNALAETWVAKCHNLEFRYDRGAKKAAILMQTAGGTVFEVATGPIGLDNGVALRATVGQPVLIADDDPVNEIGLNKSRNIVYLVRHRAGSQLKDGVFCETPITVVP